MEEDQEEVVIVGAGPSGATLALHLAKHYRINALVLSRHRGTANTPRAHIFNQRAMEVLRDAGLEEPLSAVASSSKAMEHTSWLHSLCGEEYGRLWSWGNDPARKGTYEASSPCQISDLPQTYLEPVLVDEATKSGARFKWRMEFVSLEQTSEMVLLKVRDRETEEVISISTKYLIGADGARSTVLEQLGIPVDGRQLNTAFNVHIKADLARYFQHRPGSLNWIMNPDAPDWSAVGNFRMVRPWTEFVVSMHPGNRNGKPFEPSEDDIKRRLYQMIGEEEVSIQILSTYRWTINDQRARSWQQGRVLCIGDATHRHPPINGLGSNTCVSDAFNLAWKLAYVLNGWASTSLLDTLTVERKPVGDGIVKRAIDGMEVHRTLWSLLGLTVEDRRKAVATLKSVSCEGESMRKQFRETLEKVDDEVQAIGIQMNQRYVKSPATRTELEDVAPDFSSCNPLKDVMISTFPGYHLPHFWLAKDGQSERLSSLDLVGKGWFVLFTGVGGSKWIDACQSISGEGGPYIKGCSIGFGCDFMDAYRDWARIRGVPEDGAVLVRPDHFVAWRSPGIDSGHKEKLRGVLRHLLGLHS